MLLFYRVYRNARRGISENIQGSSLKALSDSGESHLALDYIEHGAWNHYRSFFRCTDHHLVKFFSCTWMHKSVLQYDSCSEGSSCTPRATQHEVLRFPFSILLVPLVLPLLSHLHIKFGLQFVIWRVGGTLHDASRFLFGRGTHTWQFNFLNDMSESEISTSCRRSSLHLRLHKLISSHDGSLGQITTGPVSLLFSTIIAPCDQNPLIISFWHWCLSVQTQSWYYPRGWVMEWLSWILWTYQRTRIVPSSMRLHIGIRFRGKLMLDILRCTLQTVVVYLAPAQTCPQAFHDEMVETRIATQLSILLINVLTRNVTCLRSLISVAAQRPVPQLYGSKVLTAVNRRQTHGMCSWCAQTTIYRN